MYGQFLKCINCNNKDINFDDDKYAYCHVCDASVINRCLNDNNCGKLVSVNARFCPYCGAETLFNERNILPAWDVAKKYIKY